MWQIRLWMFHSNIQWFYRCRSLSHCIIGHCGCSCCSVPSCYWWASQLLKNWNTKLSCYCKSPALIENYIMVLLQYMALFHLSLYWFSQLRTRIFHFQSWLFGSLISYVFPSYRVFDWQGHVSVWNKSASRAIVCNSRWTNTWIAIAQKSSVFMDISYGIVWTRFKGRWQHFKILLLFRS